MHQEAAAAHPARLVAAPPLPDGRKRKARRMRKHVSCLECRTRKIKCDRNVPNCSSCVQRGLQHTCRWGDERDAQATHAQNHPASPADAAPSRHASPAQGSRCSPTTPLPRATKRPRAKEAHDPSLTSLIPELALQMPGLADASLSHAYTHDQRAWRAAMEPHFTRLPQERDSDELVAFYLRELEPLNTCFNSVIFMEEYSTLKTHVKAVRTAPGDAAHLGGGIAESIHGSLSGRARRMPDTLPPSAFWEDARNYGLLSVLFAMLYTACDCWPSDDLVRRRILPACHALEARSQALDQLHTSSLYFLHESHCQEHPTLWTLQSIILLQRKPLFSLRVPVGALWNATALRLAQLMGLNRLGSASDDVARCQRRERSMHSHEKDILQHMPWLNEFAENDLPRRELARKIWSTLVMFDWIKASFLDYTYVVPDEMNCTAPPAALTDEEVRRLPALPPATLNDPNRASPAVFARIRLELARCVRQSAAILIQKMSRHQALSIAYPDVMKIDQQLCDILDRLPNYFRFDSVSEVSDEVQALHSQHPYLSLQRLFVQEQVHFRRLRLHCPYLLHGLRDPIYRRSLLACMESAQITVAVWEELQRTNNPNRELHYMKWHLLSAAIVLDRVIGSMERNGIRDPSTDYARFKTILRKAVQYLESCDMLSPCERLYGSDAIASLRRVSKTPEPQVCDPCTPTVPQQLSDPNVGVPSALQEELFKLGNSIPSALDAPDWGDSDANLIAGLDFIMMNGDALGLRDMQVPTLAQTPDCR